MATYEATATVYNLTVEDIHTYHIAVGTDTLVHNCGKASTGRQVTALGAWGDIKGLLGKPGFNVLNLPWKGPGKWNWTRNKRLIDNALERRDDVRYGQVVPQPKPRLPVPTSAGGMVPV